MGRTTIGIESDPHARDPTRPHGPRPDPDRVAPDVPTSMAQQIVGEDELIVVVSSHHPWARESSISIGALCATPLVLRERGSGTRRALADRLSQLGRDMPSSALDLGSLSAVRIAVISGSAPTVISRLAVTDDLASGSLVEVPVDGLRIERRLMAIWQERTVPLRLPRAFLAHLTTASGAAPGVSVQQRTTGPNR